MLFCWANGDNRNQNQKTMKKILYTFIPILFLNCSSNHYKNSISEISNVEIKYEDGKIISGKLNFPIYLNQKYLYLKSFHKGKIKINSDDIAEITYKLPNDNIRFTKSNINGKEISTEINDEQILQLVSTGKINLYKGYNYGFLYENKNKKFLLKTDLYYCKRENEQNLTLIYYVDDGNAELLKTKAIEYFSNSEEFRNSLENKNFNSELLINFINKYNNENK